MRKLLLRSRYILFSILLIGCNSSIFDGEPQAKINPKNPLRATIECITQQEETIQIAYWKNDAHISFTQASTNTNHSFTLTNLSPNTTYYYQPLRSGETVEKVKASSFTTGAIAEDLLSVNVLQGDSTAFDGHILIRRFFKNGVDAMLNSKGEITWYENHVDSVLRPFYYTEENSLLAIHDSLELREYAMDGSLMLQLDFEEKGRTQPFHHEIFYNNQKQLVTLSHIEKTFDLSSVGGNSSQNVRTDHLLVMDTSGTLMWSWSPFEVANPAYDPEILNRLTDWGHANAIAIAPDGNFLISFRDFSQVWKVNATTGELIWRLGKNGDFDMPEESFFIRQHSIHFNTNGDLMLFDNGDREIRPESRIVAFSLDEANKMATPTLQITLPRKFSSYRMCSAYMIDDEHILACIARKDANLLVLDTAGTIKWHARVNHSSYRAYYIPQ